MSRGSNRPQEITRVPPNAPPPKPDEEKKDPTVLEDDGAEDGQDVTPKVGQEHPTVREATRAAATDAQIAKVRESGAGELPTGSQKKDDQPIPNAAVPKDRLDLEAGPGPAQPNRPVEDDPLQGMPDSVVDALLARLQQRLGLSGLPLPGGVVPAGRDQDAKSQAESVALRAEADKTTSQRTQEACDRMYAPLPTDKLFRCRLADGNGHPNVVVPAASPVDARARYMELCGIRQTDKQVTVTRVMRRVTVDHVDWTAEEEERLKREKRKPDEE